MANTPLSPAAFAAARRAERNRCWTCQHPLRKEIEDGRAAGVSNEVLADWLAAEHPETPQLRPGAIRNHFAAGHTRV